MNVDWSATMATVLTGLVVVFVALILLVIIIYFFGKISSSLTQRAAEPKNQAASKPTPAPKVVAPQPQVVEFAADGLSDEVVAAITGAISAILAEEGDGKTYVVKSIKRIRQNRHAWGKAGVAENTRPF